MVTPKQESWTVYYQTGGTANFAWHKASPSASYGEAQLVCAQIVMGGRPALIEKTSRLDSVWLPDGAKDGGVFVEWTERDGIAAHRLWKTLSEESI